MRGSVSPAVAQILREEAAREAATRRAEAAALETQPDLGLDRGRPSEMPPAYATEPAASEMVPESPRETMTRPFAESAVMPESQQAEEARRRMARLRGEPVPGPAAGQSRREVFPDIEQINSTLRSTAERAVAESEISVAEVQTQRRGFRTAFSIVVVFALLLGLIYVLAAPIGEALPQLMPLLDAYREWVDGGRLWLDLRLQDLLEALQGEPAPASPAPQAPAGG